MTLRTIRSGLGTVGLAILLMAPAGAFTFGDLAGTSSNDGERASVPWSRNTFVKVRAAVDLPTRASSKRQPEKVMLAPQPASAEDQPPDPVQNLHRVDGR
jgi:hypothetical protein